MKSKKETSVLKKIKRIKDSLAKEKTTLGCIHDGRGLRYIIPKMLMDIMALTDGKRYYTWFNKNFPDDIGEPYMFVQWMCLFYYRKEYKLAKEIIKKIIHQNIYVIQQILGKPMKKIEDFSHSSNYAEEDYISVEEIEEMSYIDDAFKNWLEKTYASEDIQSILKNYIDLRIELNNEHDLNKRREILKREEDLFNS